MRARIAGAGRGARWLADGWRLFRAAPLGWLALIFVYWLLMSLLSAVPLLGVVAAAMLVPGLSVGFMAAARCVERGGKLEVGLLFDGFRNSPREQIVLGLAYCASLAAVMAATMLVDGGALAEWLVTGRRPADDVLYSDAFSRAMLAAALLYLPVMMMFWFAPPLAAWHSTGPVKALFFSLVAFVMNWRGFLAYGAVTALVLMVVPFVALTLLTLAGGGAARPAAVAFAFPLVVLLMPTLFASFYASYRDVFGAERPGPEEPAAPA